MAMGWWANSRQSDQQLLRANSVAALLTALHFGLMGSPLGMSNQLVNAGRFALSQHARHWLLPLGFAALALLQGILLANHWSEWLVVSAAVISSFLLFYAHGWRLRLGLLLCAALNLTLSLYLWSYSGIIYQTVNASMLINSLWQSRNSPAFAVD